MTVCTFKVRFARRIPDPVLPGAERHILLCNVEDVPTNIPKDKSNVRSQNIDKRIYKEVARHLRNEDGTSNTFHLKNKGITVLADKVTKRDDDFYDVYFSSSESDVQGIVDGGHTYEIIRGNQAHIVESNTSSENKIVQFVKFEILTGVDSSLATEIAGGLNKAVQVNEMTLANYADKFDWMKEELKDEPYLSQIAFRQNDEGIYDVADILRFLELFNTTLYPHAKTVHPVRAYTGKENVLNSYLKDPNSYKRLRPILKDILKLHDTVSSQARKLWNASGGNRKAASLTFIENAGKEPFEFPFINDKATCRLFRGVLFPMLAAFRWMVVDDPETGDCKWRGSFHDVLALWSSVAVQLIQATKETSDELGRKPDSIGKSQSHWQKLYQAVVIHQAVTMPSLPKA